MRGRNREVQGLPHEVASLKGPQEGPPCEPSDRDLLSATPDTLTHPSAQSISAFEATNMPRIDQPEHNPMHIL